MFKYQSVLDTKIALSFWNIPEIYELLLVVHSGGSNKKLLTIQTWTEKRNVKDLVNGTHYHPIPVLHTYARTRKGLEFFNRQ